MCLKVGMEKASHCTLDKANTSVQVWVWDYNSGDVHVQHLGEILISNLSRFKEPSFCVNSSAIFFAYTDTHLTLHLTSDELRRAHSSASA